MNVTETTLPGVRIVEPEVFSDERGFFMEIYQERLYKDAGISGTFIQDNISFSQHGVLRGLHFQNPGAQGKLVYVLQGEVFDVAVDIRRGSPTFGEWFGCLLSDENKHQLWIPEGFAHGFCVTSKTALFVYKCTDYYKPENEGAVRWNDPAIGIKWPLKNVSLSEKDQNAPELANIADARLPEYSV